MSWSKFDDRFDDNRKIKAAWRAHARAVGLYVMAVTYSARHELDGVVDSEWLHEKLTNAKERTAVLRTLVEQGLFIERENGAFEIHDYLDFHPSRAQLAAKREKDRERKSKGGSAKTGTNPDGVQSDSARNADGIQVASGSPRRIPAESPPNPRPAEPGTPLDVRGWLGELFEVGQRRRLIWASNPLLWEETCQRVEALLRQTNEDRARSVMRDIADKVAAGKLQSDLADAVRGFIGQAERTPAPNASGLRATSPLVVAEYGNVGENV